MKLVLSRSESTEEDLLAQDLWSLLNDWRKSKALSYMQVIGVLHYIAFLLKAELFGTGEV